MPTEEVKEAFRAVYKEYQDSSQALIAVQRDLLAATAASSQVFRSSKSTTNTRGADDWDGEKARRAADTIDELARHHEIVARALQRQAIALRAVTNMASELISKIGPENHAVQGAP